MTFENGLYVKSTNSSTQMEVFSPYETNGPLEHVHLSAGIGRFSMKSISKVLFSIENLALQHKYLIHFPNNHLNSPFTLSMYFSNSHFARQVQQQTSLNLTI